MDNTLLIRKLEFQEMPQMLFSDIDGTLFSPNANILTAPLFNIQTAAYLKAHSIPFVIVTGRSFWRKIDQYHLKILGVPRPDVAITANGTIIYTATRTGYVSDFMWQGIMQSTKVTDNTGKTTSWNKWEITEVISNFLREENIHFSIGRGNTYLIRLRFDKYSVEQIETIRKEILQVFPKGIRIIMTEKLLWQNTLSIFSGEMLITPSTAGKDKAIQYLLKQISTEIHKPIHAVIFGDATVDVPMLAMKQDEKYFTLSQYGVHPTPLAREVLQEKMKTNSQIKILEDDGPKEILWTLKPELRKYKSITTEIKKEAATFSPAQNNKARKTIRLFEKVLDKIVDKNLSPNEVSFLGLQKLSLGLALLNKPKASVVEKTKGIYHYSFGNLTDVLDGIRARNSDKKEENGQLVDGFSDRAKEFMQLFQRAKKRLNDDPRLALQTFLVSISCALPSIARSQVEISGNAVSERDEKGGSMIDRTKRLFMSLLFTTVGLEDQSAAKDLEIYSTNLATFENRLSQAKKFDDKKITTKQFSKFQNEALERFLLYVDVLQQENEIIKKFLTKYPAILKEYEKQSSKLAKIYFEIPVNKLRKKWGIKNYKLTIQKYLG